MTHALRPERLRAFVGRIAALVDVTSSVDEAALLEAVAGAVTLRKLTAHEDWLPNALARPHPERYQQFLLHEDSSSAFPLSVSCWGGGVIDSGTRSPRLGIDRHAAWRGNCVVIVSIQTFPWARTERRSASSVARWKPCRRALATSIASAMLLAIVRRSAFTCTVETSER
jgi:hypothetical protein